LGREISGFGQRPWFRGGQRDRTWAARAGVTQSHRQALLKAREAGWRTVLILEDDVNFAPDFSALTTAMATALREQDWQLCYLGFTDPWSPCRKLTDLDAGHALYRVHGCNTAHAYLVREKARDWLLGQLPDEPASGSGSPRIARLIAGCNGTSAWNFPSPAFRPASSIKWRAFLTSSSNRRITPARRNTSARCDQFPGISGYYFRHALRRVSVRIGLIGDSLRGLAKRLTGF
jgi:hypothetical protein